MLVYVLNNDGQPLMPTGRCGKVRRLLRDKKAKAVKRCPFTIQLLYEAETNTQPITLGVDAGSKHIGVSATTEDKVLYEADVELRDDIVKLLSTRREQRNSRRNRKTRYRKPRFNNRKRTEGWLAPSVQQKVDCHLQVIANMHKLLPITKVVIETASFDIQKIKNPEISGTDYQQGDQLGFWNVREYVLFRDGHTCQCCKGKSKDPVLNVHHIESRKTGGDAPNNLITLCETCHKGYHAGTVKLPKTIRRGVSFRDEAFMGIMRWTAYNRLKDLYPEVSLTYGYLTKNTRIRNGLPKEHYIDARCISGHPDAEPLGYVFYQKKVRSHNRQIHKSTINKGGYRKLNQAPYTVFGFRLWDKVIYKKEECFVQGRRSSGYFQLKRLDGSTVTPAVSYTKLRLVETEKHYITKRRQAIPHHLNMDI
jgi:N6-L-threonylcarbamoyladenine synthase